MIIYIITLLLIHKSDEVHFRFVAILYSLKSSVIMDIFCHDKDKQNQQIR